MRTEVDDWAGAVGALAIPAERVHAFSPSNLSLLEIREERDLELLTKLYANGVLLGRTGPEAWNVEYSREFHITGDSKHFPPIDAWLSDGFAASEYGFYEDATGRRALPLYEGRLVDQFDFFAKNWISGKGRSAVWGPVGWPKRQFGPQYLMAEDFYRASGKVFGTPKIALMQVTSATNARTVIGALTPQWPGVDKTPFMKCSGGDLQSTAALAAILASWPLDAVARLSVGAMTLGWYVLESLPVPPRSVMIERALAELALRLNAASPAMADYWASWMRSQERKPTHPWQRLWAVTPHERLRLRCMVDAIVASAYGLSADDVRWILRECDLPKARIAVESRSLDPKGFWRVDKDQDPELRHTTLTTVAFAALEKLIADHGGDADKGVRAFMELNGGEGWLVPESLRLADFGLGRDARATEPQAVATRLGPRFCEWQLSLAVEDSWAECEHHARVIVGHDESTRSLCAGEAVDGEKPEPRAVGPGAKMERGRSRVTGQRKLFE